MHIDICIRDIEKNIKDKQIRNAYKEVGSLKASFQLHMDLCSRTNNDIISKEEEIKTRWKTYFQDLLTPTSKGRPKQSFRGYLYRVSQEERARLRESVPYVKVYRYNPKHLYPKLNGYRDNGQRNV